MVGSKKNKPNYFRNKKFVAYAVLAIIVIGVSLAYALNLSDNTGPTQQTDDASELVTGSRSEAIERFASQFCGLDSAPNSSAFVIEYPLPSRCEMPLGILVDSSSQTIWYVSTKNGTLGSYDSATDSFTEEYRIPSWPARDNPTMSSQVWDLDIDEKGNIWFTDEQQNALWRFSNETNSFDMFIVPEATETFGTTYPVSMELDNNGTIYFVGIRSPSIWIGNISNMMNGTSDGIEKVQIPLASFEGIDPDLVSTGSLVLDEENDKIYVSLLAFNTKGQIIGYDIRNNNFTTYDMPSDITSPVGMTLDSDGNIWVTDHGTSIFYRLDPISGTVTKFATSVVSPRTFGGAPSMEAAYTLPYWIETGNGTVWFNQHYGNKISSFDPSTLTLTEYWIPSQNRLWGPCENSEMECGISNALQLDVGDNNEVWFTEWSENKIGKVLTDRATPFSISVDPSNVTLDIGENKEIKINVTSNGNGVNTFQMSSAGSFTTTGNLGNVSGHFSENAIELDPGQTRQVSFVMTPAQGVEPGNYTLMLGAETSEVAVLRAVPIRIL